MSVLIKADDKAVMVDSFAGRARPSAPVAPSPLARALNEAVAQKAALQRLLDEMRDEMRHAVADARAAGVEEGRRSADDEQSMRLTLLEHALDAAQTRWEERLEELDTLAALLVRAALAKMFAAQDDLTELTMRTIAHRIGALRRKSIVALHVSPSDFADEDALLALSENAGVKRAICAIDPGLAAGECRLGLQLGEVAIGVADQARSLDRLLAQLSSEPV